jgi:hypothetical protein
MFSILQRPGELISAGKIGAWISEESTCEPGDTSFITKILHFLAPCVSCKQPSTCPHLLGYIYMNRIINGPIKNDSPRSWTKFGIK